MSLYLIYSVEPKTSFTPSARREHDRAPGGRLTDTLAELAADNMPSHVNKTDQEIAGATREALRGGSVGAAKVRKKIAQTRHSLVDACLTDTFHSGV